MKKFRTFAAAAITALASLLPSVPTSAASSAPTITTAPTGGARGASTTPATPAALRVVPGITRGGDDGPRRRMNRHERRAQAARARKHFLAIRRLCVVTPIPPTSEAAARRAVFDAAKSGKLTAAQASTLGVSSPRVLRRLP